MPSRFPGMDPFIEGQLWADFHSTFINALRDTLVARLRPRYVIGIEDAVFLVREDETPFSVRAPDVSIAESGVADEVEDARGGTATALAARPVTLTLPQPRRVLLSTSPMPRGFAVYRSRQVRHRGEAGLHEMWPVHRQRPPSTMLAARMASLRLRTIIRDAAKLAVGRGDRLLATPNPL